MKSIYNFLALVLLLLFSIRVEAQIPRTLSYQGMLTTQMGSPRPDGEYVFTFCLYTAPTGGKAIWREQKQITVKKGMFTTFLGDAIPFADSVMFDQQYWLGITLAGEAELTPRVPLSSVGYSMNAARIAGQSQGNFTTGISISDPHVPFIMHQTNGIGLGSLWRIPVDGGYLRFDVSNDGLSFQSYSTVLNLMPSGDVLVGKNLVLNGGNITIADPAVPLRFQETDIGGLGSSWRMPISGGHLRFDVSTTGVGFSTYMTPLDLWPSGDVIIGRNLAVTGKASTQVLEITGGSDLAEPFEITNNESLTPGTVVVIDPDNSGKLMPSKQAYDKRVAGVISGAGGINPGLTLNQQDSFKGGQHVALSGKVYVWATAANGQIAPGDMLTTSDVVGYAMKATDKEKSFGTIIGKAMSSLEKGEGIVLMLVNLQ